MSRIFRKTLVAVVLVFGVTANATALLSAWLLHRHLTDEYVAKGRAIAMAIAAASPDALVGGDVASVQAMIDEFLRIGGVGYVFVTDRHGQVVAHTFVPALPADVPLVTADRRAGVSVDPVSVAGRGDYLQVTAPILAGEAGEVSVGMDKAGIWQSMRGAVMRQEGLMLGMLAVALVVFYLLVRSITGPLVQLAGYAVKIRDHDFSATPPAAGDDEVGVLARAMQSMAGELALLVSDLKRAVASTTRELKDTLAHTRAIIDNLADGLVVIDAASRISLYNPALVAMFGLAGRELAGAAAGDVFPEAMAALAHGACQSGQEPAAAEVRLAGGGTGKAVASAVRLVQAPGERAAIVILVRDITMEKEVDRMKTEFISTVSHELRTPLTSVLGFAKIIRRKFLEDIRPVLPADAAKIRRCARQIEENLGIIVAEGERLTELVDDVLDIAKMESGRYEWDMAPLSPAEAADHAVQAAMPLAARKGLSLQNSVPRDLPAIVGDRDRLVQVLLNLIGNAVKFTASGEVSLSAEQRDGHIRVTVRDTGTGIASGDLERIFEKFRQAGDTLTEKPKGTGLGLPICRQIVERHGGRIWAESRLGEGSAFIFTLPIEPPAQAAAACRTEPAAPLAQAHGRKILVVDDDAAVRRYLETVLAEAGYSVAQAASGPEALALAASWRPECITMDLRMPGMDGAEAIRALRAGPDTRDIPVVVVSVAGKGEGRRAGGDAAVVKPVDQAALLAAVRGLLEGHDGNGGRPCLVYSPNGSRQVSRHFFMCPGAARECGDAEELWDVIGRGFSGTVFVPASRGHDLDLARLCAAPDIQVIIIPD